MTIGNIDQEEPYRLDADEKRATGTGPALYILFDFAEDLVILVLLNWPSAVDRMFRVLTVLPNGKARGCLRGFRSSLSTLRPFVLLTDYPQFMTAH